jgi:hypothetical protein
LLVKVQPITVRDAPVLIIAPPLLFVFALKVES